MKRGFSLIVLVVTIIVTIIISGTVLISTIDSDVINKAKESTFKANVTKYVEELDTYHAIQKISNKNYQMDSLTTQVNLTTYIPSITAEDEGEFAINEGILKYSGTDRTKIRWCNEIKVLTLLELVE